MLIPPIAPQALEAVLSRLDGILFPGGADIEPAAYGAARHSKTRVNRDLDRLELAAARWAVRSDVPILGICRGQQLVNVALGGWLVQHLDDHRQPLWPSGHSHQLRVDRDSRLAQILGATELEVNSFHHQAVEGLGDGLLVLVDRHGDQGALVAPLGAQDDTSS